jgi:cobalt-zinc-cadmium efflux system outer membrane protein
LYLKCALLAVASIRGTTASAVEPRDPALGLAVPTNVSGSNAVRFGTAIASVSAADANSTNRQITTSEYVERLKLPSELPGAAAPQIQLPPLDKTGTVARGAAIATILPPMPPIGSEFEPGPGAQALPLSLQDLEQMGRANSPTIQQAMSDVRASEGAAVQAGLYPNPTVGYEADNINTGDTVGYQGGFIDQAIKTGGKLDLSRASAQIDVENARVALHRADVDLATSIRTNYYAVLVARENVRISHLLASFSDAAYSVQVDMVKGGEAAAYEPLQLRALAYQARATLIQARNRYASAWKQLAATLGMPGLPPAELAGKLDSPVPIVPYDRAMTVVLTNHSDVVTAANTLRQARINLRLAEVNRIPDVSVHTAIQKDYTTAPFGTTVNVTVGVPLPLWDRNQGNILSSEAALAKANEGPHLARTNLATRFADAYERYQSNLTLVNYFHASILPDQVQAYRGTYARHQQEPEVVGFSDVVAAQQGLSTAMASYVTALGALWQAVVDLGGLLEADDLSQIGDSDMPNQLPDLEQLCPLPCRCTVEGVSPAQAIDRSWLPEDELKIPSSELPSGESTGPHTQ